LPVGGLGLAEVENDNPAGPPFAVAGFIEVGRPTPRRVVMRIGVVAEP
jgi:hypothetical protein